MPAPQPRFRLLTARYDDRPVAALASMHVLGQSRHYAGGSESPYLPFFVTDEERLRHIWVCGKSGMGKSTFLENQAAQTILDNGGLVFIDPHGASAKRLISIVPPERRRDVIWFAPGEQKDFPIGYNPLYCPNKEDRADIAADALQCLYALFHDSWGPQLEMICGNALLAIVCVPDGTLMSVKFMITSKTYRERVLTYVDDTFLKQYWEGDFLDMPDKEQRERVLSTLNKITKFLTDPMLRNIIAQPVTGFDFADILTNDQIFIADLSGIGMRRCALLGSFLISTFHAAALKRTETKTFTFILDEMHRFISGDLPEMFSGLRKFGVAMIGANQYTQQLVRKDDRTLLEAVKGTVGTLVAFRIGSTDADELAPMFEANPLVLMHQPPFSAHVITPSASGHLAMPELDAKVYSAAAQAIRDNSRTQYGVLREKVQRRVDSFILGADG